MIKLTLAALAFTFVPMTAFANDKISQIELPATHITAPAPEVDEMIVNEITEVKAIAAEADESKTLSE